jgi:hypothetical protein
MLKGHFRKKLKMVPKTKICVSYFGAKVAYPWSLYGIKIARIEEIKNLTIGHNLIAFKN